MGKDTINNKIVAISGGLGDIGSAIAVAFGKKGYHIAIGDMQPASAAQPRLDELKEQGAAQLHYQQVDVTAINEVENWLATVEEEWGTPQIIIPNAGIVVRGMLTSGLDYNDARKQIDVNFWGSYHLAVAAAQRIKKAGLPGRICFIGSWAAERPMARISSYCISKAAVRMLCKTLAIELAADGILVNEVAPGIVEGGLSKQNQQKDPELLNTQLGAIPVHRLIGVDEVAQQVLWLCDFEHNHVTGNTLLIDGGLSLTSKMTP